MTRLRNHRARYFAVGPLYLNLYTRPLGFSWLLVWHGPRRVREVEGQLDFWSRGVDR